jgi:hypothetical protein
MIRSPVKYALRLFRQNYSTTRPHLRGQKRIGAEISNKEHVAHKTCIKLKGTLPTQRRRRQPPSAKRHAHYDSPFD